jgi:serine/threonine protein kinase
MEGTMGFIAPELLQEQPYTERVDVYAFGMCVLEMATNEYPFSECGNKLLTLLQKTSQGLQPEALARVEDPELRKLIEHCLLPAEQRPSAKELLENTYYPLNDDFRLEVAARVSTSIDMMIRITLKICLRGRMKTIQFDYDISKDTPTSLVREIQADVLKDEKLAELENLMIAKLTEAVKPAIRKLRQKQLTDLLQKLELEMSLMDSFAKEEITIVDLTLLQESDWDRLGIPLGPRRRIQQYLTVVPPPVPAGLSLRENSFNSLSAGPSDNAGPAVVAVHGGHSPTALDADSLDLPSNSSFTSVMHPPFSKSHTPPPATPTARKGGPAANSPSSPETEELDSRLKNTSLSTLSGGPPPPPKKPIAA